MVFVVYVDNMKCQTIKKDPIKKDTIEGHEYITLNDKDTNYKIPVEALVQKLLDNIKIDAKATCTSATTNPTVTAAFKDGTLVFDFKLPQPTEGPAGEKGEKGEPGKDGVNGKDGEVVQHLYKRTASPADVPTQLLNINIDEAVYSFGWSKEPKGVNGLNKAEWMCIRTKDNYGVWKRWGEPLLIGNYSVEGTNGKDGAGVEIIFATTDYDTTPDVIVDNNKFVDGYLPVSNVTWFHSVPKGVPPYKIWISTRTYNRDAKAWGEFSNPSLLSAIGFYDSIKVGNKDNYLTIDNTGIHYNRKDNLTFKLTENGLTFRSSQGITASYDKNGRGD